MGPEFGGRAMSARPSARGRLSRSAEFERVYRQGRSVANRHLVLYTFPNASTERPRLGLSVSRKVGGAVERNKVKRLLREAFAHAENELLSGQDVVVVARPSAAELAEREGLAGIDASLASWSPRRACTRARRPSSSALGDDGDRDTPRSAAPARSRTRRADRRGHTDRALSALHLTGAAAPLQVRADLLALCARSDRSVRHT